MAISVNLKNSNNVVRPGVVGFSWTTLFFGFFVPLFRGDWKWFFIMLIANSFTYWLASFVFCFIYNNIYTRGLLEKGYFPADEYSRQLLAQRGMVLSEEVKATSKNEKSEFDNNARRQELPSQEAQREQRTGVNQEPAVICEYCGNVLPYGSKVCASCGGKTM